MHKFQPRIHLVPMSRHDATSLSMIEDVIKAGKRSRTYAFSETAFMAVTAYQNQLVRKKVFIKHTFL